ncbi:hypothetical protein K3495_g2455 [Podosphaera aphanis]|nr:hypothetical protein K3495_g2455 [Podosphaera aphanis]
MMLSEDEIDDLLYCARIGDKEEFETFSTSVCAREKVSLHEVLRTATDQDTGNGVFHMAAANGYSDLIRQLCNALSTSAPQGDAMLACLNAQNLAGNTALHWAALNGHLETVQVLIEHGANPTIRNCRGHDAIYEAELNDKTEIVEWVLKEGGEGLEGGMDEDENTKNAMAESSASTPSNSEDLDKNLEKMNINVT